MLAASNYDQNMKRITFTAPDHIYNYLKNKISPGSVSNYVSDALQSQIDKDIAKTPTDPFDDFLQAYKKVTKKNKITIREAIGRDKH